MTDKEKVVQFLAGLGLTYIEVPETFAALSAVWEEMTKDRGLREAPFTTYLGCIPDERAIVGRHHHHWASLIHEAGHLLCEPTVLDRKAQEIEWFGWEWAVVQYLDLPQDEFLKSNRDYGIDWHTPDGEHYREEVGNLRAGEVEQFFGQKVETAKKLGLVLEDGTPVAHSNRRFSPVVISYKETDNRYAT